MFLEPLDTERILADDHPVHAGYVYWVDGEIIRSDVSGDVLRFKRDLQQHYKLKAVEVRNCDIFKRAKD